MSMVRGFIAKPTCKGLGNRGGVVEQMVTGKEMRCMHQPVCPII